MITGPDPAWPLPWLVAALSAVAGLAAGVAVRGSRARRGLLLDPLTGLPNLAGFIELAGRTVAVAGHRRYTVVKFRLTHPQLLDSLSATETDTILIGLSDRIGAGLRAGERLARVGDATFVVLLPGDADDGVRLARGVMLAVEDGVATGRRLLHVGLAAGVAAAPGAEPGIGAQVLLQRATIALNSGNALPGDIEVFSAAMRDAQAEALEVWEVVAGALDHRGQAVVQTLYEPVVDLTTGRLAGIAARAGLDAGVYGTIPAGRLIAMAREIGRPETVDEMVLAPAIRQFGEWTRRWPDTCGRLWLALCTDTLARPRFPDQLTHVLAEAGVPAGSVVLETLDHADGISSSNAARSGVRALRRLGLRVVVGDGSLMTSRPAGPDHTGAGDPDPDEAEAGGTDGVGADYFDVPPVLVQRCTSEQRALRLVAAIAEAAAAHHAHAMARQVTTVAQQDELMLAGCTLARGPLYGLSCPVGPTGRLLAAVAAGTWNNPAGNVARRHRSSQAWQQLRHVLGGLPIAAFACDRSGVLDLAEGALLDELGGAAGSLGRPLVELLRPGPPGDEPGNQPGDHVGGPPGGGADGSLGDAVRVALGGTPTVCTVQAGGHWLQVHLRPSLDDDGVVTGALGVAIDISVRVRAEGALRHSEQRFRSVFRQAPVGMAIVTPDSRIQEANPALASMLGYTPDQLVGRTLTSLWHPDSTSIAVEQYEVARTDGVGYHAERLYLHRDGSPVWARVTVGPLAEAPTPGTIIGVVEDLRTVKQLEVELRHAQKLEAVGMLAAGIAHEINTPIQFIGDNLSFLADAFDRLAAELAAGPPRPRSPDDDLPWLLAEVPPAIEQSREGVARVTTIVGAMRNFGHPDGQTPSPVDVDRAIRDTATVARNEYKYVADLVLDLGEVPPVLGYPSQFHQVMLNLIVNAAHAMENPGGGIGRGEIRVRSWADEHAVHISVADTGCGMTAETQARMFDPFFTTKAVGKGTGQGLTIVHNVIVEKHHGAVTVDSTPGHGSTFTLSLPRDAPATTPVDHGLDVAGQESPATSSP